MEKSMAKKIARSEMLRAVDLKLIENCQITPISLKEVASFCVIALENSSLALLPDCES